MHFKCSSSSPLLNLNVLYFERIIFVSFLIASTPSLSISPIITFPIRPSSKESCPSYTGVCLNTTAIKVPKNTASSSYMKRLHEVMEYGSKTNKDGDGAKVGLSCLTLIILLFSPFEIKKIFSVYLLWF